jgi:hypothetical protein
VSTKILLAGSVKAMNSLEASRWNQVYRNDLGDALRHIADQVVNNGAIEGIGSGRSGFARLNFRLELETREADEEAAA